MNSQWLLLIFLVVAIILAIDVTRRAIFTIISSNNEQKVRMAMRRLRKPTQPWVTVLVYGKNQSVELEKTVRKIRRSQYGAYDIVAVNDYSNDDTSVRMKRYIDKTNSQVKIQFLQRRVTGTKMDAYRAAYRKSQHGKIIVCLDAGDQVDSMLLKRAVVSQTNKRVWRVDIRVVTEVYGLTGMAKSLRALFRNRSDNVLAYSSAALRLSNNVNRYDNVASFFWGQILLIGVIVLGVIYGGFIALWYAWVLFSLYLLALIWIQYGIPTSRKLKFSFSVPSALFFIPAASLAEGIAQLHIRK